MGAVRLAADGWRDVSWFDELVDRITTTARGELWFVAGNRWGLLDQVRARARDLPNCMAVGPDPVDNTGDDVRDGLVAAVGTALGLIHPLTELALLLGDVGMRLFRERKLTANPDPSDLFGFFNDLIGAATAKGSTVVFIVDADNRDEDLWNRRLTQITARAGRLQHQRLAMIVGLADAPPDAGNVDASFPALVRDAALLVADSKAEWHWVPPLTPELVMDVLPVTDETARLLVTVAGADDHLATQRWTRWVDEDVVRPREGSVWSLTGDAQDHVLVGIERAFDAAFGTDGRRVDRGQLGLTCAALLGDEFCVETVLRAMVFAGEDYEAADDDLDELLGDDDRRGLLQTVDYDLNQPGRDPEYLWRYRFDDPAAAVFFRGAIHDDAERERLIRSLLTNLVELRLEGGKFDITIGRLAREVGDAETATMIEDRFATLQELTQLEADTALLLSLVDTWDPTDVYLCNELAGITQGLYRVGLADLAVACGSAAVSLARANADTPGSTLARALRLLGVAHRTRGEPDQAIDYLTQALSHEQALFDQQPTPAHRRDLALNFYELGAAYWIRGEPDEAIDYFAQARAHFQTLFDQQSSATNRRELAVTLSQLAVAQRERGEFDQAIDYLTQALSHHQALFDEQPTPAHRRDLALGLDELGDTHRRRGEPDQAIDYFTQALSHHQALFDQQPTPAHRRDLALTLHGLGRTHRKSGEPDQAIDYFTRVLSHQQTLFDEQPSVTHRRDLALSLIDLGLAHRARGELDQAIDYFTRALSHQQRLLDEQPAPVFRRDVGASLYKLGVAHRTRGELDQAIDYLTRALSHQQRLLDEQPSALHRHDLDITLAAIRDIKRPDVQPPEPSP